MKNLINPFACLALLALFSAPLAAQKVYVDWDRDANFTQYKTYAWLPTEDTSVADTDPLMHSRMRNAIEMQLRGYRLSTAEILYWMPDHPSVLQSFVWQQYDKPPEFPELHRFLGFWKANIDATLHSRQWAEMPGIPQPMRF